MVGAFCHTHTRNRAEIGPQANLLTRPWLCDMMPVFFEAIKKPEKAERRSVFCPIPRVCMAECPYHTHPYLARLNVHTQACSTWNIRSRRRRPSPYAPLHCQAERTYTIGFRVLLVNNLGISCGKPFEAPPPRGVRGGKPPSYLQVIHKLSTSYPPQKTSHAMLGLLT